MESTSGIEPAAGPGLWSAADLSARDDWVLRLDAEGLEDIAAALAGVKGRGLALTDIAAEDFPLPSMAGQLAAVK
ncbi:MAG: TauD/TfdA family dioxygenase, partial [Alphaproteobacteria bacterium]|nr:TauD/TfdA family dioxygenase [Alphaproteobacteria bacterium]